MHDHFEYPTPQQLVLLRLLAHGLKYGEIANEMGITASAVSSHALNLRERLRVRTNEELILKAARLGLLSNSDG